MRRGITAVAYPCSRCTGHEYREKLATHALLGVIKRTSRCGKAGDPESRVANGRSLHPDIIGWHHHQAHDHVAQSPQAPAHRRNASSQANSSRRAAIRYKHSSRHSNRQIEPRCPALRGSAAGNSSGVDARQAGIRRIHKRARSANYAASGTPYSTDYGNAQK